MSHGITATDGAFYGNRQPAWHNLGTVIDADVVTSKEAINLAGLDWTVEQYPVFTKVLPTAQHYYTELDCSGYVANVRSDTRDVLAIVSDKYQPVQNVDAFAFMDDLLGGGDVRWHTAGSLYGGRRIWALARLDRDVMIGNDPDEKIDPFICLATSHDGSLAMSVYTTPVRVVCQNTLKWSLERAHNVWRTRHTSDIKSRIAEARATLGMANAYYDVLAETAERLINTPMTPMTFWRLVENLVPLPTTMPYDELDRGGKVALTTAQNKRQMIRDAITVDNLANIKDTRWGFVQAVAEYQDWMKPYKNNEVKTSRLLLDSTNGMKQRALELALSY